jgi:hypothetical protein
MIYTRIFSTDDGGSSMEEVEVASSPVNFVPGEPAFNVSAPNPAENVKFLRIAGDWYGGWHPTPVKQFVIVMSGGFESKTTDGKSRRFGIGDIVLLDDIEGRGHESKMFAGVETLVAAIELR